MNSSTVYLIRNQNSIEFTKKRDEIYTNKYLRGNNGIPDGADIDEMLPASAPNQYFNMEHNNKHYNLQRNGNISTTKKLISFNIDVTFCYMTKGVLYLFQYTRR